MADRNYEVEFGFNKYMLFVNNPMGNKTVISIPGVQETLAGRLNDQGFEYAYEVYNEFLYLGKDKALFQYWMYRMCAANKLESNDAFMALQSWDNIHAK